MESIDLIATHVQTIMEKCEVNSTQFIGSISLEKIHKVPDTALTRTSSSKIPIEQAPKIYFKELENLSDEALLQMLTRGTLHEPVSCPLLLNNVDAEEPILCMEKNFFPVNSFEHLTEFPVQITKSFGNRIKLQEGQEFLLVYKQNDKFSMACVIARIYLYCIQGSKYLAKTPEEDFHLLQDFFKVKKAPNILKQNSSLIEWNLRLHEQVKQVVFHMMYKNEELDLTLQVFEKSLIPFQEIINQ